ncbi:MAG: beta-phosphoglucomutase [Phycisphaeraceae bacterium]|nr:MAG: beta-phosphoglucomutase [Phycisphaeraceae bacterium]
MTRSVDGVIFDLDGVLVTTDDLHFRAWKALADREGIPFTRGDNERLRGVSRTESLEIILEKATRTYTDAERAEMAAWKNDRYRALLDTIDASAILPGAIDRLDELAARGVALAIGSSSKNARTILDRLNLISRFRVVVDGGDTARSKPDPEIFALAVERLGLPPHRCLVVEDAAAGVQSGLAAGCVVLAVGYAAADPVSAAAAHAAAPSLADITVDEMLSITRRGEG